MNTVSTDQEPHYLSFLDEVKNHIRESRIRIARTCITTPGMTLPGSHLH